MHVVVLDDTVVVSVVAVGVDSAHGCDGEAPSSSVSSIIYSESEM